MENRNVNSIPNLQIHRTKPTELGQKRGVAFPGFIKNGDTHFTNEISIYEDGIFDAWGALDLDFMEQKIQSNWIKASVLENHEISMHALGRFISTKGEWSFESKDYLYARLWRLLQNLNPDLIDLYDFEGSDVEIRDNGARYAKLGGLNEAPTRFDANNELVKGNMRSLLVQEDSQWYFIHMRLYADGMFDVSAKQNVETLVNRHQLGEMIESGKIAFELKNGTRLHFDQVGSTTIEDSGWYINAEEFLKEIDNNLNTLQGKPSLHEMCRNTMATYQEENSEENLEALRIAYFSIPEHERHYLGDMDTKDWEYRRILGVE